MSFSIYVAGRVKEIDSKDILKLLLQINISSKIQWSSTELQCYSVSCHSETECSDECSESRFQRGTSIIPEPRCSFFCLLVTHSLLCVRPQLQIVLTPISLSLIGHFQTLYKIVNSSSTKSAHFDCVPLLWQEPSYALGMQQ